MKNFNFLMTGALFAFVSMAPSFGQTNISTLADANGNLTSSVTTLDAATDWRLDKKIYVSEGKELHIEAGTVIKANVASGLAAPALIVTRGGKIFARGNEQAPIIFTSVEDALDGSYSVSNQGKWGGIIVLGRAYNNLLVSDDLGVQDGEGTIEGLDAPDARHHYGQDRYEVGETGAVGTLKPGGDFNDEDNSGVIKYVSIRHGGAVIGTDNEINGLTCGSVGRGTVLEHIEIISNQDDGVEFFGGTADIKYASILFCDDDYIDWDQGYTGRGQFIFGAQLPINGACAKEGDHGLEIDGDDGNTSNGIMSNATFFNCTFIGNLGDPGIEAKENTMGEVSNSIFANFDAGIRLNAESARANDAYENFIAGDLVFRNNTFVSNGALVSTTGGRAVDLVAAATALTNAGNIEDASLIDYTLVMEACANNAVTDAYNAVPAAGTATTNLPAPADDFFDAAPYRGAFVPGATPWTSGWTYGDVLGSDNALNKENCATDLDGDGDTDVDDLRDISGAFNTDCKK